MISCLILYHPTITSLTKAMTLRAIFHNEDFEIEVVENHTVIIYIWNIQEMLIWRTAKLFESTNIATGYGFGDRKQDAMVNALVCLSNPQSYQQTD